MGSASRNAQSKGKKAEVAVPPATIAVKANSASPKKASKSEKPKDTRVSTKNAAPQTPATTKAPLKAAPAYAEPKPAKAISVAPALAVQATQAKSAPLKKGATAEAPKAKGVSNQNAAPAQATPAKATVKKAPPAIVPKPVAPVTAPQAAASPAKASAPAIDNSDPLAVQALNIELLAQNLARAVENSGKALAAYLQPRETGEKSVNNDTVEDIVRTLGKVADYWMKDPSRSVEAQTTLFANYMSLWEATLKAMSGEKAQPVASPAAGDKRFNDPQWSQNPLFDFVKQFYLVTSDWANQLVSKTKLPPHAKHKAEFYTRLLTNAVSPTNFPLTNPEVLRETFRSSGENLVRGTQMLAEDIAKGHGDLRLRQVDESPFHFGQNIAATKGKVVFQNDLMQLLHYEPTTEKVGALPLIIMPPWINKFYILDLNPQKSFVKWCLDQGLAVFVISWVNPDSRHAKKSFADYIEEGPLKALDVVTKITGAKKAHMIGYCVGGTLLATALGYMKALGDNRLATATFFTTQVDFTHGGDLMVFADKDNIESVEKQMEQTGYLDGSSMASAFNLLRSNELYWSYIVNNYMKGLTPMAFDLLYWNSDSTRMPAANHSFYLRHCYLKNDLSRGRVTIRGKKIDLSKVTLPIYNLSAREDHIAPALSVFTGCSAFGGPVEFVMSGSGHIAGVVNPPAANKYQFWTGGKPKGRFVDWVAAAKETPGSWWPHWRAWIADHDKGKPVAAWKPGDGPYKAIEDAPGSYVQVRV